MDKGEGVATAVARTGSESMSFSARPGDRDNPVSAEERHRMIAVAAYYKAECRAFVPGEELCDWFAAEREIDYLLLGVPTEPAAAMVPTDRRRRRRRATPVPVAGTGKRRK